MTRHIRTITQALRPYGFELHRHNKHLVFKNSEGRTLVCASTPSDHRAYQNIMRDARRALGVTK